MRNLKIVFGTDFHGSETCFRKMFNLADRVKADVVVLGGDWTGKALVPVVEHGGEHRADMLGQRLTAQTAAELAELEKKVHFNGFYTYRCKEEEYRAIADDETLRDRAFRNAMLRSVERWIDIAEDKLRGSQRVCVSLPGNDDDWEIDAALDRSDRVLNSDGRVVEGDGFSIIGLGVSNPTPWKTARELPEQEILTRLRKVAPDTDEVLIANVHVPPYRSTLDEAPQLNEQLEMVKQAGSPVMIPVGSTAVRDFLQERQPAIGLHGHVHESRSHTRLGSCLAVNPGSDYASGVLQAVVVTVDLKKRKVRGHQYVSG